MTTVVTPTGARVGIKSASPLSAAHYDTNSAANGTNIVPLIGRDRYASYATLYATQPWLYAVVNKMARGIARLPLKTYRYLPGGDRERLRTLGLAALLSAPHPNGSRYSLVEHIVGEVALYGNALLVPVRAEGAPLASAPVELWPASWRHITVEGDDQPMFYTYSGPRGDITFTADEVVHFRYWNPGSSLIGISPVEPLRQTLANEDAASRYSAALFENAARPSGIVTTDKRIQPEHRKALREELQQLYGGVDRAFRVAVIDGGLDWKSIGMTARDAGMEALRKLDREEVAAVYDVPPPLVGILDHATFSNVSEQHRMLYMDTYGPWMTMVEETLQSQLVSRISDWSNVYVEFDVAEVMRGSITERANAYAVFRHVYTLNELRAMENLPAIDSAMADTVAAPLNEYGVGVGNPMLAMDGGAGVDGRLDNQNPPKSLADALDRYERRALSRVGAGKDAGFDAKRFTVEVGETGGYTQALDFVVDSLSTALATATDTDAVRAAFSDVRSSL